MALDGWDINTGAAGGVVVAAQGDVDRLTAQETALTTAFEEAATACDHLDIGDALNSLLGDFAGPLLQSAKNAGNSICGHTSEAINAYIQETSPWPRTPSTPSTPCPRSTAATGRSRTDARIHLRAAGYAS